MTKKMNIQTSKLVMGLALSCISSIISTGIANQVVFAQANKQQKCDISAYVTDKDAKGLNVRNGASPTNRILGKIPGNETVKVIAASGNWAQINNASSGFKGTGWVYLPMLGLSTRGYSTNGVDIYLNANPKSKKVKRVPASTTVKLLGCQGQWAQVEYQGAKGWLAKPDQCAAALTTCS
jgi:uncharacterized protein YgiM (DUF1202 family)